MQQSSPIRRVKRFVSVSVYAADCCAATCVATAQLVGCLVRHGAENCTAAALLDACALPLLAAMLAAPPAVAGAEPVDQVPLRLAALEALRHLAAAGATSRARLMAERSPRLVPALLACCVAGGQPQVIAASAATLEQLAPAPTFAEEVAACGGLLPLAGLLDGSAPAAAAAAAAAIIAAVAARHGGSREALRRTGTMQPLRVLVRHGADAELRGNAAAALAELLSWRQPAPADTAARQSNGLWPAAPPRISTRQSAR